METKAKKRTYNIIMVALIAVIVICGILAVGHIRGRFGGSGKDVGESGIETREIKGVVNIERSGIGYSLESDIAIQPEDIVETRNGSEAVFAMGSKNSLSLNENSEIVFPACTEGSVRIQLDRGEFFAEVPDAPENFAVDFGENSAAVRGTVFSVSRQEGSSSLTVYEGKVDVTAEDGNAHAVEAGEQILITRNAEGNLTVETTEIKPESLSDYLIEKLHSCDTGGLCFAEEQLNQVTADREEEKEKEAKALEQEAIAIAESEESGASSATGSEGSAGSGSGSSSGGSDGDAADTASGGVSTCTISIRCSSILNNMDKLKSGKNRYVPSNGVILATSAVEFRDGETAYDVTKRACSATGIQIEASYSPVYGSYYVEGINHLYEFDCGERSGWLYKINGWAPNYGCSEYKLKNGDSIVWEYTCSGN